jgi:hypothetical protein
MATKLQSALLTLQSVTGLDIPDSVNSLTVRNALNKAYSNPSYGSNLLNASIEEAVTGNGMSVPSTKRELLACLNADVCAAAIERLFVATSAAEVADLLAFATSLVGDVVSEAKATLPASAPVVEAASVPPVPVVAPAGQELSLDEIVSRRAGAVASASAHEAEVRTHRRIDQIDSTVSELGETLKGSLATLREELIATAEKLAASKPSLDVGGVENIVAAALARLAPAQVAVAAQSAADLPKVPEKCPYLLENSTYHQIADALESGDFLLVFGPAGTGKSYPVEQACARLGRRFVSLSCNRSLSASVLLSNCRLKDGTTVDKDGVLVFAMRHGLTLLLDEFDNVETADAEVLNRVSEYWSITVPETGEVVEAHPDFRLVITANNVGDSTGAYDKAGVPPTIKRRARLVRACNMTLKEEVEVITRTGLDKSRSTDLAKWFSAIRPHHYGTNGIHQTLTVAPSLAVAVKAAKYITGRERRAGIAPKSTLSIADAIWAAYVAAENEDGFATLKSTQQWFPEWDKYTA